MARIVVKGRVEALYRGARAFEHLGKVCIAKKKRSSDIRGLVRRDTSRICSICLRAKSGSSLKSDVLA